MATPLPTAHLIVHPIFGEIVVGDLCPVVTWMFRGSDVRVESVLAGLNAGQCLDDIVADYPTLDVDDMAEFLSFLPFVAPVLRPSGR